jgi:hypothetical protein
MEERYKKRSTNDTYSWFQQAARESEENEMYAWFADIAIKTCGVCKINNNIFRDSKIIDDIVQSFLLELSKDKNKTVVLYEKKNVSVVVSMVKRTIYQYYGEIFFKNKMDYSRYQKIEAVCEKYNIPAKPEYAYKISGLMDDKLSIPLIITLLESKKPSLAAQNEKIISRVMNGNGNSFNDEYEDDFYSDM